MKKAILLVFSLMLIFIFSITVKADDYQTVFSFYDNNVEIKVEGGQWLGNFKTTDELRFEIHSTPDKPIVEFSCGGLGDYTNIYYAEFDASEKITNISRDFAETTPLSTGTYFISFKRYFSDENTNNMINHGADFLFTISEDGKNIPKGAEIVSVGLVDVYGDWESISPNLRKYVLIAYKNNLIDGYPGGWFKPQQTITRAETSALLMKVWRSTAMEKVVFE